MKFKCMFCGEADAETEIVNPNAMGILEDPPMWQVCFPCAVAIDDMQKAMVKEFVDNLMKKVHP